MLYYLTQILGDVPGGNLFNYITFRAGGATMTALLISFFGTVDDQHIAQSPKPWPAHSG